MKFALPGKAMLARVKKKKAVENRGFTLIYSFVKTSTEASLE
jgi:hypothetical protein